ncbi:tetratricopeptide repeat protein [Jannaschia rubra]|uniref:tetratricopeptide repeat protein n=1 Tax=Jannaschia rubra TaxID=282197 RepID=UPI00249200A4|nr:tetratricopeptide repeat protein [Jannaschia rubra]
MSNPESFIDEVTEEVRRDRLYAMMRRWGWVAVVLVLLLVGGAAWTEWQNARRAASAQAFGDALLVALSADDIAARRAALAAIEPADGGQFAILSLLRATADLNGEDGAAEAARDDLMTLADTPDVPAIYRHLALAKVMLNGGTGDAARDGAVLEELAAPGAPFRTMAVEMQALAALDAGDEATALTLLRVLTQDAEATEALRRRAVQLIVALGASPEPA